MESKTLPDAQPTSSSAVGALVAVSDFELLSATDTAYAGGKGANLGELTKAGFPVPPGFVVAAPAYEAFCDGTGLRNRIAARLEGLDVVRGRPWEEGWRQRRRSAVRRRRRRARCGRRARRSRP